MNKPIRFTVPILNTEYKVCCIISNREIGNKLAKKHFETKDDFIMQNNIGLSMYKDGLHPLIWVSDSLSLDERIPTLAHEAIHCVTHIMIYLAMDLSDKSGNEFLAHSVAAIIRNYQALAKKFTRK